ncbi:hypothetical protein I2W78_07835 [Streptomyces spinoverrucosus]|uniref:hypothetical protein n=1 Tax=Streptomyces spinoverrucosus TaxID=284043 RepID=UPI0018C37AB6|nr:hypothetical protein [Streptomyces spinoverrucosus]MBG0851755.1 hypothetical protein [Streptomyces spinoverrucosus]
MRADLSTAVSGAAGPTGPGHLPSLYGGLVLGALVLSVALVLGLWLLRRGVLRRRAAACGYFAATVAGAVVAGTAVAAGPTQPSEAAARPGAPLLSPVTLGGRSVPVTVVPGRPGLNLVGVAADGASAGVRQDRLTAGRVYPGSEQTWVTVRLPEGRSRLWVSAAGTTATVAVDTGKERASVPASLSGSDGPECAAAAVGALLAGGSRPLQECPADRLDPADAADLRSVVGFLAGRGERAVALAGDDSARSVAAAEVVRDAARRAGLDVTRPGTGRHPLIVVAGWERAAAAVEGVAGGRTTAQGTYLAPWLLTPPLLSPGAGQIIPLRYVPRGPDATRYLTALGERLPGEPPAAAGYRAWRSVGGTHDRSPAKLYAVAVPYVPGSGGQGGGHHHAARTDWLPDGMIVPVTGPLKEPA